MRAREGAVARDRPQAVRRRRLTVPALTGKTRPLKEGREKLWGLRRNLPLRTHTREAAHLPEIARKLGAAVH